MTTKRLTLFISAALVIFLTTSCRKDPQTPADTTPKTMNELVVPQDFDWKTTKDYKLTVSSPVGGILEVKNSQDKTYLRAYLLAGQAHTTKLCLPAYEKTVQLKIGTMSGQLELNAGTLSYQFQ
ncbi:MAG: hypothetical protein H3C41_11090 [Bacteroidales bacterium]|nr:hypothetical protein [Bacteroidales bacterium]